MSTPPLQHLASSTKVSIPHTQAKIDEFALQIEQAITRAQHATIPKAKINLRTRRWWDPTVLNPLKGHALNLRRLAQRTKLPADKIAYRAAQAKFQKAVKDSKRHHWQRFLENLTDKDLFTAAKYCDGPPPSRLLPPLRQTDGTLTNNPVTQADLLFQATGGPTITCDLTDLTELPPPAPEPQPFTHNNIHDRIRKLKVGRAPGADGITAQMLKSCGEGLLNCLVLLLNACLTTGFFPTQ